MGINPEAPMAASSPGNRYGITSAISESAPTPEDLKLTEQLEECLRQFGLFETEEELGRRMEVLRRINGLVKDWVKTVSLEKVSACDFSNALLRNSVFAFLFSKCQQMLRKRSAERYSHLGRIDSASMQKVRNLIWFEDSGGRGGDCCDVRFCTLCSFHACHDELLFSC